MLTIKDCAYAVMSHNVLLKAKPLAAAFAKISGGYFYQQRPKLVSQLAIQPEQFIEYSQQFSRRLHRLIGCLSHIQQACVYCFIRHSLGEADAK